MATTAGFAAARAGTAGVRIGTVTTTVTRARAVAANLGRNAREAGSGWAAVLHQSRLDENAVDQFRVSVAVLVGRISRNVEERTSDLSGVSLERPAVVVPANLDEVLLNVTLEALVLRWVHRAHSMADQERVIDQFSQLVQLGLAAIEDGEHVRFSATGLTGSATKIQNNTNNIVLLMGCKTASRVERIPHLAKPQTAGRNVVQVAKIISAFDLTLEVTGLTP